MLRIDNLVNIITYLIVCIACGSVVRYINPFIATSFILLCIVSVYIETGKYNHLPSFILTLASIAMIVLLFLRIDSTDFVMPSLEAVVILISIKLLQKKQFRDYMQIYAMSLLLLAGSTLISIDIFFLLYFISLVLLLNCATVALAYYSEDASWEFDYRTALKIIGKTSLIALIAIPMTGLFFIILPRTNYPLLSFLNLGKTSRTGFSDQVHLGEVSDIQANNEVVFRAQMARQHDDDLYWRGIVLDHFNGKVWKSTAQTPLAGEFQGDGSRVQQTIYLEPYDNNYLFALDKPVDIQRVTRKRTRTLSYQAEPNISGKIKYLATSIPSRIFKEQLSNPERYLQVPENPSPRVQNLVGSLVAGKKREQSIDALVSYLRKVDYKYALKNLPLSENPIEDFLVNYKVGNCEYFASSLAIMLRLAEIPSRVIGGYRGGSYNEIGKYYVVTQSEAHVWVEAYLDGKGWMRLDPTPAVMTDARYHKLNELIKRISVALDTINYYWSIFVINYSFKDQLNMISHIARTANQFKMNINYSSIGLYGSIVLVVLVILFLGSQYTFRRRTPEVKLIDEFIQAMDRHGCHRRSNEGLEEFLSSIMDSDLKHKAHYFIDAFQEIYYRDLPFRKQEIRRLKQLLGAVKNSHRNRRVECNETRREDQGEVVD
jgi:protein-glutamine gamma-glutamyltransferase